MRKGKKIALWVVGVIVGFMALSVLVAEFAPSPESPKVSKETTEPKESPKAQAPKAPKPKPKATEKKATEAQIDGKTVTIKTIEPKAKAPKKKAPAPKPRPKPAPKVEDTGTFFDLDLTLNWDGYNFILVNKSGRDWTNVEVEINAGLIASGYKMRVARIARDSKVTLRARNFTKSDGLMFNPQTHRPQKVSVMCDVAGSTKKGWWIGQFGG